VRYGRDTTFRCAGDKRQVVVEFSESLGQLNEALARNLMRITPLPSNLEFAAEGTQLRVSGDFSSTQAYAIELRYAALTDRRGRVLDAGLPTRGVTRGFARFERKPAYLRFAASKGVVERYGAQQVPVVGRHDQQVDLRVHRINPLDRNLWPFPQAPVLVNESAAPPGPGERPVGHVARDRHIDAESLAAHIKALGSADYSNLLALPLSRNGAAGRFGLDLEPVLGALKQGQQAGTYLVGLRRAGVEHKRAWMRVQVTDLALSTVTTPAAAQFVVTSLRSGAPIPGASVTVQGTDVRGTDVRGKGADEHAALNQWRTLVSGRTNSLGQMSWQRKGNSSDERVMRIVVRTRDDILVLNPATQRERFADNQWLPATDNWLVKRHERGRQRRTQHCHMFSDRPVYKPHEPVHLKGWLRSREHGRFAVPAGSGVLVVRGPGDREWRFTHDLSANGTFYQYFDEAKLPAGEYWTHFEFGRGEQRWPACGGFGFRKEDYKLPELEVLVHGPDTVPLDRKFELQMAARYYAGGRVVDRPLEWKVTQFPYTWAPSAIPGFRFNSRAYFAEDAALESEGLLTQNTRTSASGDAVLAIDPRSEPSAGPRRYVVEATVTGNDGRKITSTKQVLGLPGVAVGVKMPAVVNSVGTLVPQFVVVAADGKLLGSHPVTMRVYKRDWHTQLRATDFSRGIGKYVTEPVDTLINEENLTSVAGPSAAPLRVETAGVYIVEFSSTDALGRINAVRADFFVAGEQSVSWSKPPAKVLQVSADKRRYMPAEKAQLVVQSPYPDAHVLMVAETPAGNDYRWLRVRNGSVTANYKLPKAAAPRMPVHFLLMRGRGKGNKNLDFDLARPVTLAATKWLEVEPTEHRLDVEVDVPKTAQPGDTVEATLRLKDAHGKPRAGEVTLWLVDQAVLALGKERRLNPQRDFLVARSARSRFRDTRNDLFGYLPLTEHPGGGSGDTESSDLLDQVSPRKRFVPLAFFAPSIQVDASGEARVQIELPDNLTVFKLRAKAVSGRSRFGFATGAMAVRLPLLVQPQLPRFVRPGDRVQLAALARVVDGNSGPGRVVTKLVGFNLSDEHASPQQVVALGARPTRVVVVADVPESARDSVAVTMAVERQQDKARDALSMTLPVRADRRPRHERTVTAVRPGEPLRIESVTALIRAGSFKRTLVASTDAGVMSLAGAASFLSRYPYACTEQRISAARAGLALRRFARQLDLSDDLGQRRLLAGLEQTFTWIEQAIDERELVAFWPGSNGYVSLTAWTLQFVIAVRQAGLDVPDGLEPRLAQSLRRALRSDFPALLDGAQTAERSWALSALADAGLADGAYAAELARRAQFLPLENVAQVWRTLHAAGQTPGHAMKVLRQVLAAGMRTQLVAGLPRYLGLREPAVTARILPSETRTIAVILRTLSDVEPDHARIGLLRQALLRLGRADGWGSTNANAAALSALVDSMSVRRQASLNLLVQPDGKSPLSWRSPQHVATRVSTDPNGFELTLARGATPAFVRIDTHYVPAGTSAALPAETAGFALTREWFRVTRNGPAVHVAKSQPGSMLDVSVGDVIEEHVELVSASDRYHIAVEVPLAAGFEPLNPKLANAPRTATPAVPDTVEATSMELRDDVVRYFFDYLPKGHHRLRFRVQALTPGIFVQPPAHVEAMYDAAVYGSSMGARVKVSEAD
jgi:alpha-2-macroglobulin